MVLVVFEMISPELADYFLDMDKYDRELMILEYKVAKVLHNGIVLPELPKFEGLEE